jgi:hypothetical protein
MLAQKPEVPTLVRHLLCHGLSTKAEIHSIYCILVYWFGLLAVLGMFVGMPE